MHISVVGTRWSKTPVVLYYITVTVKCNATPWGAGGIYVDKESKYMCGWVTPINWSLHALHKLAMTIFSLSINPTCNTDSHFNNHKKKK